MKCPKCSEELMQTSRGKLCLSCGYNEFANKDTPPENPIKPAGPVRSAVTTTTAPATRPAPQPAAPVALVQTVPAAVQPTKPSAPQKPSEIWFKSFTPVSAYIEDPKLRLLYAKVNIGWYPIAGAGWGILSALVLVPALSLLLFNRWVALGTFLALAVTYYFMFAEHFAPLIIPWKVQLAQLQPAQNSTMVNISGQLFFRVITALLAGLLFVISFGNLGMLVTVPVLLLSTGLLCIEIYEFIKQV